jgi:mediator of replication checkpoint protein 1
MNDDTREIVKDSQTQISQIPESPLTGGVPQSVHLHFSQSQVHSFDSMLQYPTATQFSEFPEPTQDAGFQAMSPIKGRFVELVPSTIDTVIVEQLQPFDLVTESPVAKKKGKLCRRAELTGTPEDEQDDNSKVAASMDPDDLDISTSVFDVMRKASKKKEAAVDEFDKKKSAAKEMVEEQAEESEDEYAGLGGASDDESGGEDDALVKAIIDDEGGKDVDESKLAAFYA